MLVTTLPITPKVGQSFQVAISPFVADLYSRSVGCTSVIATNQIGRRWAGVSEPVREQLIEIYHENLSKLGVATQSRWNDSVKEYGDYVRLSVHKLHRAGNISVQRCLVWRCNCGAVEFVNGVPLYVQHLVVGSAKMEVCKLCRSPLVMQNTKGLVAHLSTSGFAATIAPVWASSEVRQLCKQFDNVPVLISRSSPTPVEIVIDTVTFNLDVDFVWQLFLGFLSELYEEREVTVVTSSRTLYQMFRAMQFASWLQPSMRCYGIVNPTLDVDASEGAAIQQNTVLEKALCSVDPRVLRYFLSLALGWSGKKIRVSTKMLYWISHSISGGFTADEARVAHAHAEFMDICSAEISQQLLTSLRKRMKLNPSQRALYELLGH